MITFGLFWVVYRYQTLYVHRNKIDTGGLLFPRAVNQLFTGIYVMEIVLAFVFFLRTDANGDHVCTPQGIIMVVALAFSILYQFLLHDAFSPLFQYIPITMEDDAVIRDEEFARAQDKKFGLVDDEQEGDNIQDLLKQRERDERRADKDAEDIEMQVIAENRRHEGGASSMKDATKLAAGKNRWTNRRPLGQLRSKDGGQTSREQSDQAIRRSRTRSSRISKMPQDQPEDLEAQRAVGDQSELLFEGFHDEIEDLTPDERDKLVRRAFQHRAVRANRPSVWVPRDTFGISDDVIRCTEKFAGENIWISNQYTRLDKKHRVLYSRPPPDFDHRELMQL